MRASLVNIAIAIIVVIGAIAYALHQNNAVRSEKARSDTMSALGVIRAKLEGNVNSNMQLVRGLVANFETDPNLTQAEFAELAGNLLDNDTEIRLIAVAPDLVVTMVHPLQGNEAAIGLDYNDNRLQRSAVLRARDTGQPVLTGPVDLVQGGRALIGRFPVMVRGPDGERRFWGIVSAIIDMERLYTASGLTDPDLPLAIAIVGSDAAGLTGNRFFGSDRVLQDDPIEMDVMLPSGSWRIAATPRGGWNVETSPQWQLYAWLAGAAFLILAPTLVMGRLMDERQRNMKEMRRRGVQLERLSQRLQLALETSEIGIWEMDIETGELVWDDRMNELYFYPPDRGARDYTFWSRRLHPDDHVRAQADFSGAMRSMGRYESNYRLVGGDGTLRHIHAIGTAYRDEAGRRRIVGVNWDVTADVQRSEALQLAKQQAEARNLELERVRERIEYNALHDSLTGLPNRRFLDEVLTRHRQRFAEGSEVAAILQIDLDRFKQINDTLGHATGDAMLAHVARVLAAAVEPDDFVARIGGDEFVIVRTRTMAEALETQQLSLLAETLMERLLRPVILDGHECRVGVSVGIASDADMVADPGRLLVDADIALYRAKRAGRSCYNFFDDALQTELLTVKQMADEILRGLDDGQFIVFYQPQFDSASLEITGVEALVRWNHPVRGCLPPAEFLKSAEELNVLAQIDRLVLEETLAQMARWAEAGLHVPQASVNVSARRLHDENLIDGLRHMQIAPGRVAFELVESIFLDNQDDTLSGNVGQLKQLGIDIEIDDFGTGYASIVSLLRLKPKRLKIDRQLIQPIVDSPAQRRLVGSIIEMGHSLGIEVLAEGVETMEHATLLRRLGCDFLQGYALARPMSGDDLLAFATARELREVS